MKSVEIHTGEAVVLIEGKKSAIEWALRRHCKSQYLEYKFKG